MRMQYKKNNCRICLFTAAISLGLMLTGCGHSGSTTPNPLGGSPSPSPPEPTSQVVFTYSVLGKDSHAKTIPNHIDKVRYIFKGFDKNKQAFVDCNQEYIRKFTHQDKTYEQKITIDNVSTQATEVTAAYYDTEGQLVAVGVDQLEWNKTTDIAQVDKPAVQTVDENSPFTFTTNQHVLSKGQQLILTLTVTPSEEGAIPVDLTAFATFSGIDEKVFGQEEKALPGVYICLDYSSAAGLSITASVGKNRQLALADPIYVTDQVPTKIKISFPPIDGKEVSVLKYNEDTDGVFLFYSADQEQTLGLKIASNDVAYTKEQRYNFAINELPLAILATEFSKDGQGPQPDYAVDITDSDKLSIYTENIAGEENYLAVKDHFTLQATGVNYDNERRLYKVTVKYDDATSEGLTNQIFVRLENTYGKLAFVEKDALGRELTTDDIYAGNIWVKEGQTFEHSLVLKGVVFLYNGYTVLDIPESMIPADQYPNLKEPRYSSPEQATKSVYEVVTTYEHIGSGNDYKITTTGLPEVQLIMDIDRPEDASYPELWTPIVQHFEWDS